MFFWHDLLILTTETFTHTLIKSGTSIAFVLYVATPEDIYVFTFTLLLLSRMNLKIIYLNIAGKHTLEIVKRKKKQKYKDTDKEEGCD